MFAACLIILEQIFLYVPLMLGAYLSFSLMKVPNLSIEVSFVSGAIMASKVLALTQNMGIVVSLLCACIASLIGGAFVGIVMGLLVTHAKLPHLLASILTIGLFYGVNLFMLGGANISLTPFENPLSVFALPAHPELITLGLISLVIFILCFLLCKTQLGVSFAIYGNNPSFFDFYNISRTYIMSLGLLITSMLSGLSGYLVAQSSSFVDINAGTGISLFCLTALILGKSLIPTKKNIAIFVPIGGLVIYCVIQQVLLKVGFNLKYFTMLQSIIVLVLLMIKYRRRTVQELTSDHLGV